MKKKINKEMDVVFLLDRSGSMSNCVEDTIGGFNSYLKEQKGNGNKTKVTTILFDNEYEVLHERKDIKKVKDITEKEYYVRGATALLDAIGKTINNLSNKVKDNKVLFIITTDGMENASREYTKEMVKKLIEKHKDWEFLYIGANIDSYTEASSIGIKRKNTSNYKADSKGTKVLFESLSKASNMCYEGSLQEDWKQDLEQK